MRFRLIAGLLAALSMLASPALAGQPNFGGPVIVTAITDSSGAPVNSTNGLSVNCIAGCSGSSIATFTPNGNVATRAVTSTSSNVALPAGTVAAVTNKGANIAYIKLSVGAGSAAVTDFALQPGATIGLTVGSNTFINAIADTGLTTTLSIAGGSGLVSGYGGGGVFNGAVTAALNAYVDGAIVTLGTEADTASCATGHTLIACARQQDADIAAGVATPGSAVPANTNMVGGQAGANAANFPLSATTVPIQVTTNTTGTQLVALSSGKAIYVTFERLIAAGTGSWTWEYGTGTNCGTGTTVLSGVIALTAQSGWSSGNGAGAEMIVPAGNALCYIWTGSSVAVGGHISASQF